MEEVLDLYARPYDARYPLVCMDETSKQLIADTRPPLPPASIPPSSSSTTAPLIGLVILIAFRP